MDEQKFREWINTFLPTLKLFVKAFKDKDQWRSFIEYMNNLPKNQIQNFYDEYKNLKREKINRVRITILERLLDWSLTYEDAVNIFEDEKKLWEPRTLKNWTIPRIVYPFCYWEKKHYEKFTEWFLKEVCDYVVDGASYDRNKITNPGSVTFDWANNFWKNWFYVGFWNNTHPDYTTQDQFRIESEWDDKLNVWIYHHKKWFIEWKYKKFDLDSVTLKDIVDEAKECKNIVESDVYSWPIPEKKQESKSSLSPKLVSSMTSIALNTILYWVPGTGKTYNTVNYAVSIIEDKSIEEVQNESKTNRDWVRSRYEKYVKDWQIIFTTFHQSIWYEDFIEWIKAKVNEEDWTINYIVEPWLFKNICKSALKWENTIVDNFEESWNSLVEKLNESDFLDIPLISDDKKTFKIELNEYWTWLANRTYENGKFEKWGWIQWKSKFFSKEQLYNIYKWQPWVPQWWHDNYRKAIVNEMKKHFWLNEYKENLFSTSKKNYVLIIDEINRWNISKIFWELITLLEPDKRLWWKEELKVRLPYSNEEFWVPNNLYILWTMNTADRSIALMDLALRRRFKFREIEPNSELLKDIPDIQWINIKELFETLNKRIEFLYDRDHLLWHAYFIPLKDEPKLEKLNSIMLDNIVPLLQEYFHDDWEKIQLVLWEWIVKSEMMSAKGLWINNSEYEDYPKYVINTHLSAQDYSY